MRKAERLFQILTYLRGRRLAVTAKQIADELEVSERTVYRDIQALMQSGIPINSEAGVGYQLQASFQLPPLMFNADELQALLLGIRMVQAWSDPSMAKAAQAAMQKITAILPPALAQALQEEVLLVPTFHQPQQQQQQLDKDTIRQQIKNQRVVQIGYRRQDGAISLRCVEPLGLVYWGSVWTLVAWCQRRDSYRSFRIDRILQLEVMPQTFTLHKNKNLQHYLQLVEQEPNG